VNILIWRKEEEPEPEILRLTLRETISGVALCAVDENGLPVDQGYLLAIRKRDDGAVAGLHLYAQVNPKLGLLLDKDGCLAPRL